jgi:predicted nuclease of predicted toxin-antitoxin system
MRLLLDECLPRELKKRLSEHECRTVPDEGRAGKSNGELLALAEKAGFQVLLPLDHGIAWQQNLRLRSIAIVLIRTKSSRLADLLPRVLDILKVLSSLQPGQLVKVG